MNALEILETVTIALLKQGKVSKKYHGLCAYRGDDGLKCAIGHLIKDEDYSKEMEGHGVNNVLIRKALFNNDINVNESNIQNLIVELQAIHDHNGVGDWPKLLEEQKQKLIATLARQ